MRIVSLLASATEMIAALGCLDQLVGRSHECDYPPEVQRLPLLSHPVIDTNTSSSQIDTQIKELAHARNDAQANALKALSIYAIDAEMLQRLQPDIIFTQTQCEVCAVSEQDVVQALEQTTGLRPRVVSLAPYSLQDVWEDMLCVGKSLGREQQAQERIQSYQQRLRQLQTQATTVAAPGPRPRVVVLEWLDPLMGSGNWTPQLIDYAGGENICGKTGQHAPWLTWEQLSDLDPDVLILAPCGFTIERTRQDLPLLQKHPTWSTLRAVREGRVSIIDGNYYLNRSGPRLVESAELLAHAIWQERLPLSVDPSASIRL